MTFDFSEHDPANRKVWYVFPTIPSIGQVEVILAGTTNKPYTNAQAKRIAKKSQAGVQLSADSLDADLDAERELFALHVVTGWKGVVDSEGAEVPFTKKACKEFLDALPDWLMRGLSVYCGRPLNFLPDGAATDADFAEQAGN